MMKWTGVYLLSSLSTHLERWQTPRHNDCLWVRFQLGQTLHMWIPILSPSLEELYAD